MMSVIPFKKLGCGPDLVQLPLIKKLWRIWRTSTSVIVKLTSVNKKTAAAFQRFGGCDLTRGQAKAKARARARARARAKAKAKAKELNVCEHAHPRDPDY